ncbi:hypothetical protein AV947_gp18 [Podophage Lau218]|uniref:Putative phage protein n=2 Tax=Lauvirus lau218 TaxID=1465639 RepID=A0A060BRP8_9CAUD|nr:hypothetical protein AV947_gp18 [Podophage Lau218]AIA83133.1 putative phage protein [Podophage Lau218]AIA83180.1 putative phage protein [Lauvirus lau218]AIA83229.1 putative phage protein [Lauvirus lau218]
METEELTIDDYIDWKINTKKEEVVWCWEVILQDYLSFITKNNVILTVDHVMDVIDSIKYDYNNQ